MYKPHLLLLLLLLSHFTGKYRRTVVYDLNPPAITHQPSPTSHHPPAITHQPSPTSHHPPAITHQPSPTSHHPPAITHQPSPTSHHPPAITHQPSPTNHQPPINIIHVSLFKSLIKLFYLYNVAPILCLHLTQIIFNIQFLALYINSTCAESILNYFIL